jgi:hypothetical protein
MRDSKYMDILRLVNQLIIYSPITDSPQKYVGLDAQKAARPLLLGVMFQKDKQ